ncbi:hypothetical protein ACWEO2_39960 [Nocardia sp. NPDC004278]
MTSNNTHPAHQLLMEPVPASAGRELCVGSCSCQQMTPTPPWEDDAVRQAHQLHVELVQVTVDQLHAKNGGQAR